MVAGAGAADDVPLWPSDAEAANVRQDVAAALRTACGVCLAEVTAIDRIDSRPSDGPLYDHVTLKPLRGSGELLATIDVVRDHAGGGRAPGPDFPFTPTGPVFPDSLKQGRPYWFLFCSKNEQVAGCQQRVK